ncbi:MAG: zf-HC2 domain-containing protein [Pseudomonadota bacterium]|nr:zf-HC2 domain-containing protein [Pseudomonadota bacterium]
MLSCKEVSRLLSRGEDRRLALSERVKLRLHLLVCAACARFARQLAFMREALRRYKT